MGTEDPLPFPVCQGQPSHISLTLHGVWCPHPRGGALSPIGRLPSAFPPHEPDPRVGMSGGRRGLGRGWGLRRGQLPTCKKIHTKKQPNRGRIPAGGHTPTPQRWARLWLLVSLPHAACNEGPGHSAQRGRWVFPREREPTAQDDTRAGKEVPTVPGRGRRVARWSAVHGGQHGSSKALAKGVGIKQRSDTRRPARTAVGSLARDSSEGTAIGRGQAWLSLLPGVLSVSGKKGWTSEWWLMEAGTFLRSPTCSGDRSKVPGAAADGRASSNRCVPRGDAGGGARGWRSRPRVLPPGTPLTATLSPSTELT